MRTVTFPILKDGCRIVYPDDIDLFSDTAISETSITANYHGAKTDGELERTQTKWRNRNLQNG